MKWAGDLIIGKEKRQEGEKSNTKIKGKKVKREVERKKTREIRE